MWRHGGISKAAGWRAPWDAVNRAMPTTALHALSADDV
jgi:hypothetical protein